MEVCCPSGKEIPQCDSESIEMNDMIDLLPKVLKSLKPSLTVMHLPYLVKLDGTTPSCIFV
jgi:hypothetical protein